MLLLLQLQSVTNRCVKVQIPVGPHACLCPPTTVILCCALNDPNWGCLQVPLDPIGKLPGLLDALKLMDAAVQQNSYHEKLLMYRNVRMPQRDKVNDWKKPLPSHVYSTMLRNSQSPFLRHAVWLPGAQLVARTGLASLGTKSYPSVVSLPTCKVCRSVSRPCRDTFSGTLAGYMTRLHITEPLYWDAQDSLLSEEWNAMHVPISPSNVIMVICFISIIMIITARHEPGAGTHNSGAPQRNC